MQIQKSFTFRHFLLIWVHVWGLQVVFGNSVTAFGQESYTPRIAPKSDEGERAIQRFRLPPHTKTDLFAAEPMLANPVCFAFDARGRIYVTETFRQQNGVEDNRSHGHWLLDDLAAQTVDDRIAYFKKHLKDDVKKYTSEHDRIRLLEDTDGDGHADRATVFADGFNAIEEGTGAGVLAIDGKVFYTCIPKLWLLTDDNDDGIADTRVPLYDGFGVRVAFRGHDMHGLIVGPDGRLYFSIGDRGYNVVTPHGRLAKPDQGAVFRCNLDGTDLEVFATGLRNPQELAFDDFGNLFTGDNNSDGGDRARWTYIVEGSDSGWRMYYQYLPDRGPWNREKLWHPAHPGQAAYIVPPIINIADGPSGLAYYPGTGLDEKYRGHFFLADFRGSAANSGIRSFAMIPKGASFELVDSQQYIWSILATDVDFGFDGGLYVSDWVDGWDGAGKGRIYRFRDETHGTSPVVAEVTRLMKDGFAQREPQELSLLLTHPDYRVRQRAQFALVRKKAAEELTDAATKESLVFARVHGIWGLGQLARTTPETLSPILSLGADTNPEIRAQLARVCGDAKFGASESVLLTLCQDVDLRVRSLAAIALGKLKAKSAVGRLFEMLTENADADPTLRHAIVMGLVGCADVETLRAACKRPAAPERMGAVLALRRLEDPGLADFLNDPEPLIVLEAARAIHDVPVAAAMPALAKLIEQPGMADPQLRRVLNANYRAGTAENAKAVAAVAAHAKTEESIRLEAITDLLEWNAPGPLDRVTNDFRPLAMRNVDVASVVRPMLGSLFSGSRKVRESATKLAGQYGIKDVEPFLLEIARDAVNAGSERVAALNALETLKSPHLRSLVDDSLSDADSTVRAEARRLLVGFDPARAIKLLAETMDGNSVLEQQAAIAVLASVKRDDADDILEQWLTRLVQRKISDALQLDLLEAAQSRQKPGLLAHVDEFNKQRNPADHLRDYRETLAGGSVQRGHDIFFGRAEVSCRRCHKIDGNGGDVGPDLSRIGLDKNREYLLEAIIDPNKQIARGFETVILQMEDGLVHAGIIKSDDGTRVSVQKPDGSMVTLDKARIEDRAVGKSGMPEDLIKKLSKSDIRDLVEFLSTLKNTAGPAAHGKK
ncbi:MAG: HEAT repeat domain-containing protein [Planctomycetes bacterium]|nr:HEAT repeat domain-containing protein [Planctomycetota bacterium]